MERWRRRGKDEGKSCRKGFWVELSFARYHWDTQNSNTDTLVFTHTHTEHTVKCKSWEYFGEFNSLIGKHPSEITEIKRQIRTRAMWRKKMHNFQFFFSVKETPKLSGWHNTWLKREVQCLFWNCRCSKVKADTFSVKVNLIKALGCNKSLFPQFGWYPSFFGSRLFFGWIKHLCITTHTKNIFFNSEKFLL